MRKSKFLSLLLAVAVMATMLVAVPLTASAETPDPYTYVWEANDSIPTAIPEATAAPSATPEPAPTIEIKAETQLSFKDTSEGSGDDAITATTGGVADAVKFDSNFSDYLTESDNGKNDPHDFSSALAFRYKETISKPISDYSTLNQKNNEINYTSVVLKPKKDGKFKAYVGIDAGSGKTIRIYDNTLNKEVVTFTIPQNTSSAGAKTELYGKYGKRVYLVGVNDDYNKDQTIKVVCTGDCVDESTKEIKLTAEHEYIFYVTGTGGQLLRMEFEPAASEPKEWINNSGDKENSTVTEAGGEATLTYKANYAGSGFSYDLKSILTGGPVDLSSADGIVEVSAQMYLDSTQKAKDDFFIDVSGDIETSYNYGGASDATYGRIAGHGDDRYNYYRFIGGQNSTLGKKLIYEDGNAKVSDQWVTISYKINLKDKTVTIGHNGKEHIVSGFAKSVKDALYLNVAPTITANSDNDVVIKFKDIKVEYKSAASPEFDKTNSKAVSGFYTEGNADPDSGDVTKYGIIRFLQGYTGSNVSEYGFYFVDSNGIILNSQNYVTNSTEFNPEENGGFYSDLTGIEEENWGESYSAKAYVVIDGVPYFSDSISGTVGMENDNWVYAPGTEK